MEGKASGVNPAQVGTKSAAHYKLNVGAGKTATIRLRLSDVSPTAVVGNPFNSFAAAMKTRQDEADQFDPQGHPVPCQRG